MIVILWSEGGTIIRGWSKYEDVQVSIVPRWHQISISEQGVETTDDDIVFIGNTSASSAYVEDYSLTLPFGLPCIVTSLTPDVHTVEPDGTVAYVGDGEAVTRIETPRGLREYRQQIVRRTEGLPDVATGIVEVLPGSLRRYLIDRQAAMLAGVAAGGDAQRAARPNNIAAGDGDTVQAFGRSYGAVNEGNFLLSAVPGYPAPPVDALREILSSDGELTCQWRAWLSPHHYLTWRGHSVSPTSVGPYRLVGEEIIVAHSLAPWAGSVCRLLPANWRAFMPYHQKAGPFGTVIACFVRLFHTYDNRTDVTAERRWVQPAYWNSRNQLPVNQGLLPYQRAPSNGSPYPTGGDSGSPMFALIGSDVVIIGHVAAYGQMGSYWYADSLAGIQSAMDSLSAEHGTALQQIQLSDLSGFNTY